MFYFFDIFGTFVFALSGAFRAVKYELDILGVIVLSTATGVGGGVIRDILLGDTPPAVFRDETYLVVCVTGALAVFFAAPKIAERWNLVMIADAIGLGVFTAIGAAKGVRFDLGPIGIVMMGALTATGGGVIRDLLVSEIPAVIRTDFYASAAILGSISLLIARSFGLTETYQIVVTVFIATGLRFLAMATKIHLPKIKSLPESPSAISRKKRNG